MTGDSRRNQTEDPIPLLSMVATTITTAPGRMPVDIKVTQYKAKYEQRLKMLIGNSTEGCYAFRPYTALYYLIEMAFCDKTSCSFSFSIGGTIIVTTL
jgi:hypothetical protein